MWKVAIENARRSGNVGPLVVQFRHFLPNLQLVVLVQAFKDICRRPTLPLLEVEHHPLSAENREFMKLPDR